MNLFLFTLLSGLVSGALYALSALGVSLVAGLMRVVNFSHGEFYIFGAYLSYVFGIVFGLQPWIAMSIAVLIMFLCGLILQWILIRPIYKNQSNALVTTFILSIVLQNIAMIVFGPNPKKPPNYIDGVVRIFGFFEFGAQRLMAGAIAFVILACVLLLVWKTNFGRAIRAVAQDRDMAEAIGINAGWVNSVGFAFSVALAAAAGVLVAPIFPVTPNAGESVTLAAFVVLVFGGVGSIRGCLWGGLILGLVEKFGISYLSSMYSQIFGFVLLVAVLLMRPTGMYGSKV